MDVFNDILSALSVGLHKLFPEAPCYSEWVPDKLPERVFLIGFAGQTEVRRLPGRRLEITGGLDITYLPDPKSAATDQQRRLNTMAARLALDLRGVAHNGLQLRVGTHRVGTSDGVLHDICDFSVSLREQNPVPMIGSIDCKEAAQRE